MKPFDLVIRSGEIVTAAGSLGVADIGIAGGLVKQIGGAMKGGEEIGAHGMLVFPGGIDAHVHLSIPPQDVGAEPAWIDDFRSGSEAALAGGITTLGNMTFLGPGETPRAALERETAAARKQIIADLFLHPVLDELSVEILADIPHLLQTGCNSIKIFTVFPSFDAQAPEFQRAITAAGKAGLLTLMHCEDHAIVERSTRALIEAGEVGFEHYPASRPVLAEVVATRRAVALAEATGSPIYIVHLSSAQALEVCMEAQSRNLPVYVETRPLYLYFTLERFRDADGAKFVGQPPLRDQQDVEALWAGLQQGAIHTVCTDHAPWALAAKLDPAHTIANLRPGVADLDTMLPLLYAEGVAKGRLSLARYVQLTSTNAARLFGLFPRKGTIAVGSDADLVIFDPHHTRVINATDLKTRADYSVFEGWQVTGRPVVTVRRGEIVFRDGEVLGQPGSGQIVSRGPTEPL